MGRAPELCLGRLVSTLSACIAWLLLAPPSLASHIPAIDLTEAEWRKLNKSDREEDFQPLLMDRMRHIFDGANASLFKIRPGEVSVQRHIAGFPIATGCRHHITARDGEAVGTNTKASYMGRPLGAPKESEILASAILQSDIKLATFADVNWGRKFFRHCVVYGNKTVKLHVNYTAETHMDLTLHFSNPRTRVAPGGRSLTFNLHVMMVGRAIAWNMVGLNSEHKGKNGCQVKVASVRAGSVCGRIEDLVRDHVPVLVDQVVPTTAPQIIKRLEEHLGAAVGKEVVIPVNIVKQQRFMYA